MTTSATPIPCPLCSNPSPRLFAQTRLRDFLICPHCDLVFVPQTQHLPPIEEKARYDYHRNDLTDLRYRKFLSRLFDPLKSKLAPNACGLDFGSGPTPSLSILFAEDGFPCTNYDLYYANDPTVFETQYDFLSCSETMEHMAKPREEFERFLHLVKPGGWIGIMTQLRDETTSAFKKWYYKDDKTHICFFSKKSFQILGTSYGLHVEFHANNVILFQTPARPAMPHTADLQ